MSKHYQVLIIGGGTGGIMVASRMKNKQSNVSIGIIEPSENHYYQPAFTLVGGGTYKMENTIRKTEGLIPKDTTWIKDKATLIDPNAKKVITEKSGEITYDYLVIATGLVNDFSLIEGLGEAFEKGVVCSNYVDPEHTWKLLQEFKGGTALFTQPTTPIKCGGAPQKAMYLAADYLRKNKLTDKTDVIFATPGSVIFGIKVIAETLTSVIDRYGINAKFGYSLVKIDADKKTAYYQVKDLDKVADKMDIPGAKVTADQLLEIPFDFLHLAPPQKAPEFLNSNDLTKENGWLDVDLYSLQHNKYPEIFGVGDVADLPTAKTGAAIRKQAPVVVDNILKLIAGQPADNKEYDGYSSCPLVTAYGKMVLAEFNYKNEFTPDPMVKYMLVFNSEKEHWRLWLLKKYGLPFLYWNRMMKGKM